VFQGRVRFTLPAVATRETIHLRLGLITADGTTLHDTCEAIEVFPVLEETASPVPPQVVGTDKAARLARELRLPAERAQSLLLIDHPAALADPALLDAVANGATALILELPPGTHHLAGDTLTIEEAGMEKRHFVSRDPVHPLAARFRENDFRFWFDPDLDRVSPLLDSLMLPHPAWTPVLRTGQGGWGQSWQPAFAVAEKSHGTGRLVICQLKLAGRLANPAARLLAEALAGPATLPG
jgi:hypothetical protein